jgi:hypothetical protein
LARLSSKRCFVSRRGKRTHRPPRLEVSRHCILRLRTCCPSPSFRAGYAALKGVSRSKLCNSPRTVSAPASNNSRGTRPIPAVSSSRRGPGQAGPRPISVGSCRRRHAIAGYHGSGDGRTPYPSWMRSPGRRRISATASSRGSDASWPPPCQAHTQILFAARCFRRISPPRSGAWCWRAGPWRGSREALSPMTWRRAVS